MEISVDEDTLINLIYMNNFPIIRGITKYMEKFIAYNCAPDILVRHIFPDGKEITESMAAFEGVRKHIVRSDKLLGNEKTTLVSVGDGNSPRTASLFAFLTRWNCISIDPNMKKENWDVNRLTIYKDKVENLNLFFDDVIIVSVHSHASMKSTLEHIKGNKRSMLAIPCCVPYNDLEPTLEYRDRGIWSPKNIVKIWRNI